MFILWVIVLVLLVLVLVLSRLRRFLSQKKLEQFGKRLVVGIFHPNWYLERCTSHVVSLV